VAKRVGALSTEEWGREILPGTVNKQAGLAGEGRRGGVHPTTRRGKLVRVVEGGKLHRRAGKTHFPREL
jgi:hypothetical protein